MEPRSFVLEKEKKKKTKKEKKVQGEKEKMEILAMEPFPGGLLQAIASFLQRHGFSKSLSAFNSEAHIEVDSLAADALEAIYSKHAKNRCENPNDGTSGVLKNGDSRAGTETTKDDFVASEETHKKKRKRCSDDENTISNSDIPNMGNDTAPPVDESSQPKEKKKKKLSANGGIVVDAEHNKEKLKAEILENSGLLKKVDTSDVPQSLEQSIEEPKRKKRKDKATASPEDDTLQDNGNKSQEKVNDLAINKKSEAVSNGSGYENERVQAKEKKKTKKDAPDNSTLVESEHGSLLNAQQHSLDKLDGGSDLGKVEKHDLLKSDNAEQKKIKKKKEKIKHLIDEAKLSPEGARGDAKSDKAVVTTVQKQTEGAENGSEKDQTNGLPKLTEVNDDGTGEEKGHSGNSITKITKKDSKHSAEPKTVNAFQRVNPDEVRFADERLQDNSYWAKGGADTGYGAKAQEVLGQVRGKGFRHEKTKKKRGSYRGGQIDLQSHSIKFNYSDEE